MNEEEARAIAQMVKRRLRTWLAIPEDERQTLGVITFNAEQQSLILDFTRRESAGETASLNGSSPTSARSRDCEES